MQEDAKAAPRRIVVLSKQLTSSGLDCAAGNEDGVAGCELGLAPCSGTASPPTTTVRSLPRFDPYVMETYLDDLRELKRQVYDLFKFRPDLLQGLGEGMSKGACITCEPYPGPSFWKAELNVSACPMRGGGQCWICRHAP